MSAENTDNEKITEIMTLIGVSPSDFAEASANFRHMTDTELDARLARLRPVSGR